MPVKYDYESVEELLKDRSLETHLGLKAAADNNVLFGQLLRNVMRHCFECGVVNAGGELTPPKYE